MDAKVPKVEQYMSDLPQMSANRKTIDDDLENCRRPLSVHGADGNCAGPQDMPVFPNASALQEEDRSCSLERRGMLDSVGRECFGFSH